MPDSLRCPLACIESDGLPLCDFETTHLADLQNHIATHYDRTPSMLLLDRGSRGVCKSKGVA